MIHRLLVGSVAILSLVLGRASLAADPPAAIITVTSATAGSSLGKLVEGRMHYRDRDYLLTLHGVKEYTTTRGVVYGLQRTRDIGGTFRPSGDVLKNASGVTIRFDPPLVLRENKLYIEVTAGMQPKVQHGQPGSGVEQ